MPITADDKLGNAAVRLSSGGWTSARIIIGKYNVIWVPHFPLENLLTLFFLCRCRNGRGIRLLRNILQPDNYLTGPLGESTAAATANVNVWIGTLSLLPILWAFVADAFLGRYRTIVISSSLYILVILTVSFFVLLLPEVSLLLALPDLWWFDETTLGLALLTFSAMIPSHSHCEDQSQLVSCASQLQVTLFFFSLYLVAIGQGGYKPCIKVFGADQFDGDDLQEAKTKSSFFNWLMFGICVSDVAEVTDNTSNLLIWFWEYLGNVAFLKSLRVEALSENKVENTLLNA